MSREWSETVTSEATVLDAANQNNAQLFDLSELTIIDVNGADAAGFLQGQFCNDLTAVSETRAQITGYCTPKGRLLALPIIVGTSEGFRLMLPEDVVEPFIKRLSMFVMRSAVTITKRDDWVCVGMSAGTADDDQLASAHDALTGLPTGVLAASSNKTSQIIRWHDDLTAISPKARYLRLASIDDQIAFWKGCDQLPKRDVLSWRAGDVSAGVPSIRPGVVESFVPQMLNLQLIEGLSFTKGCYPGQEIVARMQYLGKLKRHMRLFSVDQSKLPAVPAAGDSLSTDTDKDAGIVVDAQPISDQEALVLAVVKVSANDAALHAGGAALASKELPYELPSMDSAVECADSGS